jgi:hypothetical protein
LQPPGIRHGLLLQLSGALNARFLCSLASKTFAEQAMEVPTEPVEYGPRAKQILREAVETERQRLKNFEPAPASTEHSKSIQRELGGSGAYINAIVEEVASKRLKQFKPDRRVKPS